jgi:hypothetical protein
MEFKDIKEIPLSKAMSVTYLIVSIMTPFVILYMLYDYEEFVKIDVWKLLIGTIAVGVTPFLLIWVLMFFIFFATDPDNTDGEQGTGIAVIAALLIHNIASVVTVGNLIRLKFLLKISKKDYVLSSIETFLLVTAIFIALCILLIIKDWATKKPSR